MHIDLGMFSIKTPANWQLASLIMVGPPPDPADLKSPGVTGAFQQNAVVVSEMVEDSETLESYAQKQAQRLKEQGVTHKPAGGLQKFTLSDGAAAVIAEHVVTGPNGEKVRQMQLITRHGKMIHTVIASHLDGMLFETCRDAFRSMLESARFG